VFLRPWYADSRASAKRRSSARSQRFGIKPSDLREEAQRLIETGHVPSLEQLLTVIASVRAKYGVQRSCRAKLALVRFPVSEKTVSWALYRWGTRVLGSLSRLPESLQSFLRHSIRAEARWASN
jgi:hypothetical protein